MMRQGQTREKANAELSAFTTKPADLASIYSEETANGCKLKILNRNGIRSIRNTARAELERVDVIKYTPAAHALPGSGPERAPALHPPTMIVEPCIEEIG